MADSEQYRPSGPISGAELARYVRQMVLPEIGPEGQQRLKQASVLLVGAGGLGSPAGLYLAAAGVGRIGIVDFDSVDESNLQRQVLFGTSDLGRAKPDAARQRLVDLNPHVQIDLYETRLTADNAVEIVRDYDVVLDGSDNFTARYVVNDACVVTNRPNVHGSVLRFEGQISVFWREKGPCYRCLFPDPPPPGAVPNCAEAGVLGVLPGVIGTLQANEALKLILGVGTPLIGRLLRFDALGMTFRELFLSRDRDCPACGASPTITAPARVDASCAETSLTTAPREAEADSITPRDLKNRLDDGQAVTIIDVRTPLEWRIGRIPGARLIPLERLAHTIESLDEDESYVLYCHVGLRSAMATTFMRGTGFRNVMNLEGGIDAWSREVDPSVPRY